MISKARAREIAYAWHGGGGSPLYQFASIGGIVLNPAHKADLIREIDGNIHTVVERMYKGYSQRDYKALQALRDFIQSRRI